jgi:DNA-binding protein
MEGLNWDVLVPTITLVLGVVFGLWKAADKVAAVLKEGGDVLREAVDLINLATASFLDDHKIDAAEWQEIKEQHEQAKKEFEELKAAIADLKKK